jgi:RAB protein geranylgeranyltransferase component A
MILLIIVCLVFFLGLGVLSALLAKSEQKRLDLEFDLESSRETIRSLEEDYQSERNSHETTVKSMCDFLDVRNHNNKVIDNIQKTLKAYRTE